MGLIAQPSFQDILQIGGRSFTNIPGLIQLIAICTTNQNATFRKYNGAPGAGYAVTALKTLYVHAVKISHLSGTAQGFKILQSDNDVGMDSATAFTNPVYNGGSNLNTMHVAAVNNTGNPGLFEQYFTVAAGKYLSCNTPATQCTVYAWATEA